MQKHKLNDPLRWFVSPVCFVVGVLLPPVVMLIGAKEDGPAVMVRLMLIAALGIPASLYICTALVLSRINALIQVVECTSQIVSQPPPEAIQSTEPPEQNLPKQSVEEPPPMPGINYRRTRLRR